MQTEWQPDIISFGGGLPSADSFPMESLKEILHDLTNNLSQELLQYGQTEGYDPLREEVVKLMATKGVTATIDDVLITSGSQQGLDLIAKAFINPGDKIVVESPTYLAALQTFRMYGAEFILYAKVHGNAARLCTKFHNCVKGPLCSLYLK